MKPAMFEMGVDARLLKQRLSKAAPGETVSYAELSTEISRNVSGATSALHSARRSLFNETGILFSPIRGVGLMRLTDEGKVNASESDLNRAKRAARRGARRLSSVENYTALPPEKQLAHTTRMAVFSLMTYVASDKSAAQISQKASTAKELSTATALSALMSSKS